MPARVRTMGDLRAVLCETIDGVRDGTVDLAKADRIQKLAGQVSATMLAESQAALIALKVSGEKMRLGEMKIGGPDALPVIEHAPHPAPKPVPKSGLARTPALSLERAGERVFCEQCDMQVTVGQAISCKSAFCKAKAAT